jgi:hypothetical protein
MSDVMRTLRDGARQVQKLQKDLHPPTLSRRGWKDTVFARQTLGDEAEIELWYLAEHFLLAWHDWHGLIERFPRYFGEPEQPFSETWRRVDADCTVLADQLLRNKQLDELISSYWLATGVPGGGRGQKLPSSRDVYQTVVQNHRRWSLIRQAETGRLEPHAERVEKSAPEGELWPQCRKLVGRLNEETLSACKHLMEVLGQDLRIHLRHYRHANLLVSWLAEDGGGDDRDLPDAGSRSGSRTGSYAGSRSGKQRFTSEAGEDGSALFKLLLERIVTPSISEYADQFQDANVRGTARHVLERITQAIGEIGYDEFVEDVTSNDFHGGAQSLVGASSINLIPSQTRGPCHLLLLAVSKGDKKAVGFASIMRQVREHLIRCKETKAVIVLCDHWHPGMLDEHLGDLRAHHDKHGVRFLFLMVGLPGRVMSPVAVDLGMAP